MPGWLPGTLIPKNIIMNIERDAEWLKNQRAILIKAVNEVTSTIMTEILKPHSEPKYYLELSMGIAGRMIGITVYDNDANNQVDKLEIWCMDLIFDEGVFTFRKDEIKQRVKKSLVELRAMKAMAQKYVNLNDKN